MGRSVFNAVVMIAGTVASIITQNPYWMYAATAVVTVSNVQAAQQAKKKAAAMSADSGTRLQMQASSNAADIIIYGRTRIAPQTIAYMCVHGENNKFVTMVLPFCRHEITAFEEFYLNDDAVGPLDVAGRPTGGKFYRSNIKQTSNAAQFSGVGQTIELSYTPISIDSAGASVSYAVVEGASGMFERQLTQGVDYSLSGNAITLLTDPSSGVQAQPGFSYVGGPAQIVFTYRYEAGRPLVRIKRFLGVASGERDLDLEANSFNADTGEYEWSAAHLGKGVARIHITFEYDQNVFANGLPNVTAIIHGKKVWHPISGSLAWTQNAALIVADYLRTTYQVPLSRLSETHLVAAASACDESVPIQSSPGTQGRYTIGGIVRTDRSPKENLDDLLAAMGGAAGFSEGAWRIYAGVYSTPVSITLGDDDLAASAVSISPYASRADIINGVSGQFNDPRENFQTVDFPPYQSPTYLADDRAEYWADIELPYTQHHEAAQRIAKLLLFRSRLAMVVTATFKLSAYALQPGDIVRLRLTRYGFDLIDSGLGKPFRVVRRKFQMLSTSSGLGVELTLQEESPDVYAWDYNEATHREPAPKSGLPDPTYVEPLLGLSAYSGPDTFDRLSDGVTIVPYVRLAWLPPADIGALDGGSIEIYWKRSVDAEWRIVTMQPQTEPDDCVAKLFPVRAGDVLNIHAVVTNGIGAHSDEAFVAHTVASDVASIGYGQTSPTTANWLTNATFDDGTVGWTLENPAGGAVQFIRPGPATEVPGIPTCAILFQQVLRNATSAATCSAVSTPISVKPGLRVAIHALILAVRCTGYVGVRWLTAGGVLLGQELGLPATSTPTDSRLESNYRHFGRIYTAPATAAQALFVLHMTDAQVNSDCGVYVLRPFMGPAMEDSNEFPPWDAGVAYRDPITSANLLRNTTFEYGVDDWTATKAAILPGAVTLAGDSNRLAGSPRNARVTYVGANASGGGFYAQGAAVSVEPLTWIAAAADLIPSSCSAQVQINYYDIAGQYLSSLISSAVQPRSMPAAPTLADYVRIGAIGRVPLLAAQATINIVGNVLTSTVAFVSFARPFVGKVSAGKYQLPEWNAGANGQVNTPQITPEAATAVPTWTFLLGTSITSQWTSSVLIVPAAAGERIIVTATAMVERFGVSASDSVGVQFRVQNVYSNWSNGQPMLDDVWRVNDIGSTLSSQVSLKVTSSEVAAVSGSNPMSIRLWINQIGVAGSTFISSVQLRVEVIKR